MERHRSPILLVLLRVAALVGGFSDPPWIQVDPGASAAMDRTVPQREAGTANTADFIAPKQSYNSDNQIFHVALG